MRKSNIILLFEKEVNPKESVSILFALGLDWQTNNENGGPLLTLDEKMYPTKLLDGQQQYWGSPPLQEFWPTPTNKKKKRKKEKKKKKKKLKVKVKVKVKDKERKIKRKRKEKKRNFFKKTN